MPSIPPLHILRASAGSGKTFALTVHFIGLLLRHEYSYREILALTFTNKATAEMKSRIMDVLEGLAKGSDSRSIRDYRSQLLERFPGWGPSEIQQRADRSYRRILHDYSHFSVSTIDGFSQKVIRGFAYELELDGLYGIELNTAKVQRDLISRLYLRLDEDPKLFEWVMYRIKHNIAQDKPWNIDRELHKLSRIIFSEDFQAFDQQLAEVDTQTLFSELATYNESEIAHFESQFVAYIDRITTTFATSGVTIDDLKGKSKSFLPKFAQHREAFKATKDLEIVRSNVAKLAGDIDGYQTESKRRDSVVQLYQALNPTMEAFRQFLDESLPHYYLVKAVESNIYYLRLMKQMSVELAGWRADNNAQLISDAQLLLQRIGLSDQGDPTFIWEKIGNRYRYFLFDEFQDTSGNQWRNLFPLLANALSQSTGQFHEHLIVGDIKQSIYRWRNGDWRILLDGIHADVRRVFHLPDATSWIFDDSLPTNYRSQKHIVEFNNFVATALPGRLQSLVNERVAKELSEEHYADFWAGNGLDTAITRAYADARQAVAPHLIGTEGGSIHVEYFSAKRQEAGREYRMTTGEIRQLASEKCYEKVASWIRDGTYQPRDIGILVRTNDEARLLIDFFQFRMREGEASFSIISGDALLLANQLAIKTLVDTLRFMQHEDTQHACYLANMAFYYAQTKGEVIPPDRWMEICHADISLLDEVLPATLIQHWTGLKQLPLVELVEQLIGHYRFGEHAENLPALLAFRDMVGRFTATGDTGLPGFLTYWEEECEHATIPASGKTNAVEVITLHKSKGLEYPAVAIPFCNWALDGKSDTQVWFDMADTPYAHLKTIPIRYGTTAAQSSIGPQYYEEMLYNYMDALNYLYVAMTRAGEQLYILAPHNTPNKNGEQACRTIGDALQLVLAQHPWAVVEEDSMRIMHQGQHTDKKDPVQPVGTLTLQEYRSSSLLSDKLEQVETRSAERIELMEQSAAFSNTLHELMSLIEKEPEIEQWVDRYVADGRVRLADRPRILEYIHAAWQHPVLGALLRGNYRHINERSVINRRGETARPDKVLSNDAETFVIDFKSTQRIASAQHLRQVREYRDYLLDWGYPMVRGYLYYFMHDQLVEA